MGDLQRRISARQQNASSCRKYLLSGFTDHEKAQLATKIINLGSKYLEISEYTPECTHVVSIKPMRSEKYLCTCAAGKWVLSQDYILDSAKAGYWLIEEQYQWGIRHLNEPIGQTSMAKAPARWHRMVQETGNRAFAGWNVVILVENKKKKPSVYKRVIECGGGNVISAKVPINDPDTLATQITHVLVDMVYENHVDALLARGIPCVTPDYIAEYLFEEHPDIAKFLISKSPKQSRCPSVITSEVNSVRSSRRSSRKNSKNTSPLKVKQDNNVKHPSVMEQLLVHSNNVKATRAKASSAPATVATSTPVKFTPQSYKSPVIDMPTVQINVQDAVDVFNKRQVITPVKFTPQSYKTPVIDMPTVQINVQDAVDAVNKRQERDPLSFVPYWMQVKPPKPKYGDQCALPFPKVICNLIEACVEEGFWLKAVDTVTNNLSVSKFPPSEIIHIIMKEIMQSNSSTVARTGIHMLKTILCLHSPMAFPSLAQIYLQSMLPPTKHIEGFQLEEDTPIRCHWDFMDRVIRNSFKKVLPVEPLSKERIVDHAKFQMNNQLLLKYLVALLEQDFKGYQARLSDPIKKTSTRNCMMSSIIWPTGDLKVSSSPVQCLLEHYTTAVRQTQEDENMCILLRMLATLVGITGELLHLKMQASVKHGILTPEGPLSELAYELNSIASQVGLMDSIECLHIMLSVLQPSWLKMCVSEIMLQDYNDSLVLPQFKRKPLSLEKLVHYYFYLLPSGTDAAMTNAVHNPRMVNALQTTHNPRMVNALQTLADSNHTRATGQKRKLDNVSGLKVNSPMKKQRTLQINKRNAKGESPLHVACIRSDVVKLRRLLASQGILVNQTDYAGWTPLHEAANHGHLGCVKELLKFKPKQNIMTFLDKESKKAYGGVDLLASPSECGTTPLHDAVFNGHLDIVRLLVQHGGKSVLMAKNTAGWMPQDYANTEQMELALQCVKQPSTRKQLKHFQKISSGDNIQGLSSVDCQPHNGKGETGVFAATSNSCPSAELYATVLGTPQKPKRFVSSTQTEQYCMLVRHLLRAYVQVHKLADIKAEVELRLTNRKWHPKLDTSLDANCSDSSLMVSPVGVATIPLVKLTDLGYKTGQFELQNADQTLAKDLEILDKMDSHVAGFIHHIGCIGPWVGGAIKSTICRAIFLELQLLAASWRA